MFDWIKKKWNERLEHKSKKDIEKYIKFVWDCSKEKRMQLIGNFTREGFEYIYSCLIGNAEIKIVIIVNNYADFFKNDMFLLLKVKAKKGIKITIISCEDNKEFNELCKEFDNVDYYLITLKEDCKLNNEIILSDYCSYWINDRNFPCGNNFFKANANFSDCLISSKLYNNILEMIKKSC